MAETMETSNTAVAGQQDLVLVEQGCSTHRPVLQQDVVRCSLMCSLKLGSAVFYVNSYSFNKLFHYLNQTKSVSVA